VPELVDMPRGCAFAGRCAHTIALCHSTRPQATLLPDDHTVRCLRLGEIAALEASSAKSANSDKAVTTVLSA
jgi:peptide/nickel transport system ATP-binding protein